jgi:hypothetical protein
VCMNAVAVSIALTISVTTTTTTDDHLMIMCVVLSTFGASPLLLSNVHKRVMRMTSTVIQPSSRTIRTM